MGVVLMVQIPIAVGLLDPDAIFEADHAKAVIDLNAIAAVITVGVAALAPARLRMLAIAPGALVAAAMAGAAITVGGHAWDVTMAVFTVTAAWLIGRVTLRLLAAAPLRDVVVVELVVGFGVAGLIILALGRLHLLAWWSAGALTIALGVLGAWTGAREGWTRRGKAWAAITGSPVGAACAGLLLLQLGWTIVWLSAPEIMFDPLSAKAYLPQLWAHTGSIGSLLSHPQLNVTGLAEIVAVPGHAVGAPDVGRELQTLAWIVLTATIWWAGGRSVVGPLAALAVGIVPQLVWQATTADDDLLLSLGAVALAIAVLRTAGGRLTAEDRSRASSFGTAVAIGLLAGGCVWFKLHLLVITAMLVAGWLVIAGPRRGLGMRLGGVLIGGLAVAGPALVLRWIDTGNPVFPSYNTLFKSPHYLLVNEQFNFPFWKQAHLWEIVKVPYEAIVNPSLMNDAMPPGALGLLVAALVLAVLIGWRQADRRAGVVVWAALLVGLLMWWAQFRYLRYVLPSAMVAVLLIVAQLRDWRASRTTAAALLVAAGAASALYLPSTVASFWNVPYRKVPFAAAFGRWDTDNYLRFLLPEKDVLAAYQRLAPPGADAVSPAQERIFLSDRDLSAPWEVGVRLTLSGPLPTQPDDALRRLRAIGIGWAIVTGPDRNAGAPGWLPGLLARHGEIAFADRGWDLYRLVARPASPMFDARLGLAKGERLAGASRSVPACPGQTVAVELTTAPGGQPATVVLNSDSGDALSGHTSGEVLPGTTGRVYATAPPNTHAMTVAITPPIGGGAITRARIGLLGRCSSTTR
ncbi:MAG TPA: hypothetical protein VFF79_04620 [Conexibacter sp.]|nr:hypothetical protein [Conexibacter sp.]